MSLKENSNAPAFMQGGGNMGELIRTIDWTVTPLKSAESWPYCLKTAVAMILSSPFPMYIAWGKEYTQLYNDAYRPILGKEKHPQAMGISTRETFREIYHLVGPMFDGVMDGNPVFYPDFLYVLERNGFPEECYFDFSYSPIRDENGLIGGVLVICMETTEKVFGRKKLEENNEQLHLAIEAELLARKKTEESEKRFRTMAESSDILIAVGDETSDAIYFSKAWVELTGRPMKDLLEFGWVDLVHPEDKENFVNAYLSAFKVKGPFIGEFRVLSKDGSYRWLLARGMPRVHPDGAFAGYVSSCIDISERRIAELDKEAMNEKMGAANEELVSTNEELAEAEKNLQQMVKDLAASEEKFRLLVRYAPVAIGVLAGRDLVIESANEKILNIWGKTESIIGKPLAVALPELKGQPFLQILDDVFTSGTASYGNEVKAFLEHNKQLREIYFDFIYQPLKDNEKTTSIMVVAIDVTEKVIAKKDLERAYVQARLSKEAALLGTFDMDLEKGTMEWDERCRVLFGISHNEKVTYEKDFITGLHPNDRERVIKVIDDVMIKSVSNGDYDVEYRTIGAEDQQVRWIRAKGKAYFEEHDKPVRFIGSVLDITDQKTEEIRLRESAERQARLTERLEIINQMIQMVSEELDLDKIIQKITDATTELTGAKFGAFFYNKTDESGESYMLYTLSGAPREAFEKFGMPRNTAVFHPTFSGEGVVRVDDITKDPRYGKSAPHHGMPKGHLPVVSYLAVPVISRSGEVLGGLFFGHPEPGKFTKDHESLVSSIAAQSAIGIDNAKLYEEVKTLNDKKDEFIGLASHELKTPLTSISGYLQILNRHIKEDSSKKFLDKTLQQVRKLTTLVNDLLDVSKIEAGQLQLVMAEFDIQKTIDDAIELIGHSNNKYEILFETNLNSCRIDADAGRIEQVLINLLSNAIKYSPGADKVILSLSCTNNEIKIGVKDFGLGIPKDKQIQIFSRFYRVEDAAPTISGLGIGLYISKEIINRHNGDLWVESEIGKGSTFWFTLPVHATS
jgi:PAS domain S-box-containing protein